MVVDSQTRPFSSPSGFEIKDGDEDDRSRFQDTVAIDSPIAETSLDNLDFDTEPVDDSDWACEYEEEVVLDSEDEEINGTRRMSITNALRNNEAGKGMKGCGLDFQLANQKVINSHASALDQSYEGNGVSAEELEEQVDSKSTEKQSEASAAAGIATFDMYDIGFDTQMAAEAIEVLACGHTIGCSPADAYRGIGSTVNNVVKGVTEERDHSESHFPPNTSSYGTGEIAKNTKRKKRSTRKFSRGSSISAKKQSQFLELGSELAPKMQGKRFKLFGETRLCCSNSANENESSSKRSPTPIIKQKKAEEDLRRNKQTRLCCSNFGNENEGSGRKSPKPIIKERKAEGDLRRNKLRVFGNNTSSSIPLGKGQSQRHCVIVSPGAHQSRQSGLKGRLKRSEGQSFNPGKKMIDIMEHGMLAVI